jgi:hypothetical protein
MKTTGPVEDFYSAIVARDADAVLAIFNGFYNTIAAAGYTVGVYSNPGAWQTDFGTGSYSLIPNTLEWTSESSLATNPAPTLGSWCGSGGCAEFFGGQFAGDAHAVAWQ